MANKVISTSIRILPRIPGLEQAGRTLLNWGKKFGGLGGDVAAELFVKQFEGKASEGLERSIRGGGRLRGVFDNVLAGLGQGIGQQVFFGAMQSLGPASMVRFATGDQARLETARIGIGGLVSALGGVDLEQSLAGAGGLIDALRRDAAVGAGGDQDYIEGFQRILGPAIGARATLPEIQRLNRLVLGAGFALRGQEGLSLAPIDVVQALNGAANDRQTPFIAAAVQTLGLNSNDLNRMNPAKRFETLTKAFENFGPAVEAVGNTFEAQTETFLTNVRNMKLAFTGPIFDRITSTLRWVNQLYDENREKLEGFARSAGSMVDTIVERLARIGPGAMLGLGGAAVGVMAGRGVAPWLGGAADLVGDIGSTALLRPVITAAIAGAAGLLGLATTGPIGLGVAGGLGLVGGAYVGNKVGNAADNAVQGLTRLVGPIVGLISGASLAAASPAAIVGTGQALGKLGTALMNFGDSLYSSVFGTLPVDELLKSIGDGLHGAATTFLKTLAGLVVGLEQVTLAVSMTVADLYDRLPGSAGEAARRGVSALAVGALGAAGSSLIGRDAFNALTGMHGFDTSVAGALGLSGMSTFAENMEFAAIRMATRDGRSPTEALIDALTAQFPKLKLEQNFSGDVTVQVQAETVADPDTVVRSMSEAFEKLAKFPRSATSAQLMPRTR